MSETNPVDVGAVNAGADAIAAETPDTPEKIANVEINVEDDPNVAYVNRARDVLTRLENMPMGSHETRMLKEALLAVFGPALAEAEKHIKVV